MLRNPAVPFYGHLSRAIAAAIFDDPATLTTTHRRGDAVAAICPRQLRDRGGPPVRGLALAADARTAPAEESPALLSEVDDVIGWLGARADDAPMNFLHLLRLLEAERAWAAGDLGAAALAFDAARDEVAGRQRPWHRALITERAARFTLAQGLQHIGFELLAQARQEYLAWGATAKVAELDSAYPALRPPATAPGGSGDQADRSATGEVRCLPRAPSTCLRFCRHRRR